MPLFEMKAGDAVPGQQILDIVTGQAHIIGSIEVEEEKCKGLNCAIDPSNGCGGRHLLIWYETPKGYGVRVCETKILSRREAKADGPRQW